MLNAGIDYGETFAPTARMSTIRMILALAGHHQWPTFQMDVKSTFLNGDLHKEVYVDQPPGFIDSCSPTMVCRLRKALYGFNALIPCPGMESAH